MKIIYSDQSLKDEDLVGSIFLVGPTPRSPDVESWRPEALSILASLGFQGTVLVPEKTSLHHCDDYDDQVEWELYGLHNCSVIAAWVPRRLPEFPSFTTNCEFGMFVKSGRLVYGRPNDSVKNSYLDHLYGKYCLQKPYTDLTELLKKAIDMSNNEKAFDSYQFGKVNESIK